MAKRRLEFANFVCRFGENQVLADQVGTVVLPAFMNNYERSYSDTSIFLHSVRLLAPTTTRHVIAGRIVKDTVLVRETLFDRETGELQEDPDSIRSSPSSFFMLAIETHRLFYVREHRGSPSLDQFRVTMQRFLTKSYLEYVNAAVDSSERRAEVPPPELEIVPMLSVSSLENLVKRFETIEHLSITLAEVNNQTDNTPFVRRLRESKEKFKSERTKLDHRSKHGLEKKQVLKEVNGVKKGTGHAYLEGHDPNGIKLKGDARNLGLQVPIDDLPSRTERAVDLVMEEIDALLEVESIDEGKVEKRVEGLVRKAVESRKRSQ